MNIDIDYKKLAEAILEELDTDNLIKEKLEDSDFNSKIEKMLKEQVKPIITEALSNEVVRAELVGDALFELVRSPEDFGVDLEACISNLIEKQFKLTLEKREETNQC